MLCPSTSPKRKAISIPDQCCDSCVHFRLITLWKLSITFVCIFCKCKRSIPNCLLLICLLTDKHRACCYGSETNGLLLRICLHISIFNHKICTEREVTYCVLHHLQPQMLCPSTSPKRKAISIPVKCCVHLLHQ